MTLVQAMNVWLTGRSPETQKNYQRCIEFLAAMSQNRLGKSLLDVNEVELEALVRAWTAGLKQSSVHTLTWMVKGFFRTIQRLKVRPDNPGDALRPPKFEDKLADRLLTHEQVQRLLASADDPRDRLLIQVLYGAGLRISEALNLRRRDLLGNGVIRVWGKGQKTDYVRITPALEQGILKFAETRRPEDFIFESYHGKRKLTRGRAHILIKKIAAKAGLPQVSAHFFRHAHATVALKNGASLPVVQRSLRHANVQTTMRYVHTLPGDGAALYLPPLPSE